MNTVQETRAWIEALHNQNIQSQKLLRIILQLGQGQKKDGVISTFRSALSVKPIEKNNHVIFGNLALQFDGDDRLVDLFQVVPGTTDRAEVVICSDSNS